MGARPRESSCGIVIRGLLPGIALMPVNPMSWLSISLNAGVISFSRKV